LNHLKERHKGRLELDILPCNPEGSLPAGHELENLLTSKLKSNTKAIILTHASNVCGTILPLREIGSFCRKHNLFFLIDSAQTAGSVPVDFLEIEADALAFTGHKGLLGPQGIGGIVLNTRIASQIEPLITGGTGSSSEDEFQPSFMPDRFEAGTLNIPGIYGLHAALTYLNKVGVTRIREIESTLTKRFIQGIVPLKGVNLIGLPTAYGRTSVISLDFPLKDNAIVSHHLASVHGIINRCGLHCAPLAHKTLGTYPQGTVRLSFGFANTTEEVDIVLEVIEQYIKH
jgi:selenocysteine lyase/cysteine desulfurase